MQSTLSHHILRENINEEMGCSMCKTLQPKFSKDCSYFGCLWFWLKIVNWAHNFMFLLFGKYLLIHIFRMKKGTIDSIKNIFFQVDLLSASRSNLLSYVLTHYQNELYEYYSKTSRAFETLAENINCYNNYDFEILSVSFYSKE